MDPPSLDGMFYFLEKTPVSFKATHSAHIGLVLQSFQTSVKKRNEAESISATQFPIQKWIHPIIYRNQTPFFVTNVNESAEHAK